MIAIAPPCFELEPRRSGFLGGIPGCPVRFRFTRHFLERLAERYPQVSVEAVLIALPKARLFREERHGKYSITLTSPFFPDRMILGLQYPDDEEGTDGMTAVCTCYPPWGGGLDEAQVDILRKRGARPCQRRPIAEFLTRMYERRHQVVDAA
jgi:hypothetical protein